MRVKLYELAHSRAGDKGNISNLSLIPYDPGHYPILARKVTPEAVKEHFRGVVKGNVTRYDLDNIQAFNFVLEDALNGGVTSSIAMDTHGKSLSSLLLEMEIEL